MFRDLKPENILYASAAEDATLKLADFGLACVITPTELTNIACGTPGYVAPEIIRGQHYGTSVDMWSVGVILYILLCGFPPFYDDNNKKLFKLIVNAKYSFPNPYWANISEEAKDLIRKLLIVDPVKRLTAQQAQQHPWVSDETKSSDNDILITDNLKSFNARRRLRGAIRAVQLSVRLTKSAKSTQAAAAATASGGGDEAGGDGASSATIDSGPVTGAGAASTMMGLPSDTEGDSIKFAEETNSEKMNKFNPALYCDSSDTEDFSSPLASPKGSLDPNGLGAGGSGKRVPKKQAPPRLSEKMLSQIAERVGDDKERDKQSDKHSDRQSEARSEKAMSSASLNAEQATATAKDASEDTAS